MIDYKKIEGHFTFPSLYKDMIDRFPTGSFFVEVGVLYGQSLAYLIEEMIKSGKGFRIVAVDYFKGQSDGMLDKFRENLSPVARLFDLIIGSSVEVSGKFDDKSLDFVFIDADHSYENVKADILAWMPKVKSGGVLAGHDYPAFEGVKKAVDEMFWEKLNTKYSINEGCWFIEI